MSIFLLLLLIAASPVLFIFIFSEVMAAKEGSKIQDTPRKISKKMSWIIFFAVSFLLLYLSISEDSTIHLRDVFKLIGAGLQFLR